MKRSSDETLKLMIQDSFMQNKKEVKFLDEEWDHDLFLKYCQRKANKTLRKESRKIAPETIVTMRVGEMIQDIQDLALFYDDIKTATKIEFHFEEIFQKNGYEKHLSKIQERVQGWTRIENLIQDLEDG